MKVYENFDLTNFNSYQVKAVCEKAYFPENEEDLIHVLQSEPRYILIGSGHNIILSKSYYELPFIILTKTLDTIQVVDTTLEVEAGAWMTDLAIKAQELGLSGLEVFYDIPSSLGGAIVMNAGASGHEIKDVLVKVRYLDLQDMQIKEILKEEMSFEYRNSFFQRNTDKIVLKAWLKLATKDCDSIQSFMDEIKTQRWAKQPKDLPNAGSVFKRPPGYFVGAIIDELNLKGYSVGGAKISEKHGGFIVNYNNATGEDIIQLIQHVKKCVLDRFQVDLEIEQRII
ncbi:UDP-N-acetylmuramate dehydrogenase [Sphingobacterium sp. KU25419]|nr:UDP-N-acetylmuramate dehydrogenase [Sphingobacterium sp. KU25419]